MVIWTFENLWNVFHDFSSFSILIKNFIKGGNNDANSYLYPSTNTLDIKKLELEVEKIITDEKYREQIMQSAYNELNKIYSYKSVKQKILDITQWKN